MDFLAFVIRNIVFPYMEIAKGNTIRKKMRFLSQMENQNENVVKKKQEEDLKKLLLHCIENVPAYEHLKCLKDTIEKNPYEALSKFPILTKKEFNKNKHLYMAKNIDPKKAIPNKTGGSTGEPVNFYMDRETVEWYEAARWQGLSRFGIKIGDRSVMLWAPIEEIKTIKGFIKERYLKNRILISSWEINDENLDNILKKIERFRPKYFYAYPSAAYRLSLLMQSKGKRFNKSFKAVITTAENLYTYQRELIEKTFCCPVVNEYGAKDAGILAYQCIKGNMHLNELNAYYEYINFDKDENNIKKLIITDLHNYIMPRLRYDLGDFVSISHEKCDCGNNMTIINKINGREDEIFIGKDNKIYDSHFFTRLAKNTNNILQFQIIQKDANNMVIKIVKDEHFKETDLNIFYDVINKAFGNIQIDFEFVEYIPPAKSGKIRFAIRNYEMN